MQETTLDKVLTCSSLPSPPTVAVEVLELTNRSCVELSELERSILNDPALASKILKTVNSPFYGLTQPCPSIGRALGYLGINTVKSLVLSFSLVDLTKAERKGIDFIAYWQRALYSAAAARRLAESIEDCDVDEAFVAALMQDIGMLAIDTALGDEYAEVVAGVAEHDDLPEAEVAAFGFDHAEAGAALAEKWRFPEVIVDAVRRHHRIRETGDAGTVCVWAGSNLLS